MTRSFEASLLREAAADLEALQIKSASRNAARQRIEILERSLGEVTVSGFNAIGTLLKNLADFSHKKADMSKELNSMNENDADEARDRVFARESEYRNQLVMLLARKVAPASVPLAFE